MGVDNQYSINGETKHKIEKTVYFMDNTGNINTNTNTNVNTGTGVNTNPTRYIYDPVRSAMQDNLAVEETVISTHNAQNQQSVQNQQSIQNQQSAQNFNDANLDTSSFENFGQSIEDKISLMVPSIQPNRSGVKVVRAGDLGISKHSPEHRMLIEATSTYPYRSTTNTHTSLMSDH